MVTIQNEYSLLCRLFDTDLAELSANEDVKLLAYSPLATGILTGKYHGGLDRARTAVRMSLNKGLGGRVDAAGLGGDRGLSRHRRARTGSTRCTWRCAGPPTGRSWAR